MNLLIFVSMLLAYSTQSSMPQAMSSSAMSTQSCVGNTQRGPADSLYVLGEWKKAGELYAKTCPCIPTKFRTTCQIQAIRAFANDPATANLASNSLDSLLLKIEPENPSYSEALLLHATIEIHAGRIDNALKSWRQGLSAAPQALLPEYAEICKKMQSQKALVCEKKDEKIVEAKPIATTKPVQELSSSSISSSSTTVATAIKSKRWVAQLGAFSKPENAQAQIKTLQELQIEGQIIERQRNGKTLWLVVTKDFASRALAEEYTTKMITPHNLDFQLLQLP